MGATSKAGRSLRFHESRPENARLIVSEDDGRALLDGRRRRSWEQHPKMLPATGRSFRCHESPSGNVRLIVSEDRSFRGHESRPENLRFIASEGGDDMATIKAQIMQRKVATIKGQIM